MALKNAFTVISLFMQQPGRKLSYYDIADYLNVTLKTARRLLKEVSLVLPITEEINSEDRRCYFWVIK